MSGLFITWLWREPYFFFAAAFVVIFSICCHEFMHAWVAMKEGDCTAADAGHLTLNPLKQMGWCSLLLFAFLGIAWGQFPVEPRNFRRPSSGLRISLAGPLTNLALAVIMLFLCALLLVFEVGDERGIRMVFYGCVLNQVLFMLNMIPVPGFDGFAVVKHFFPRFLNFKSEAATLVSVVLILLLFSSIRYLFDFAYFLGGKGLELLLELLK